MHVYQAKSILVSSMLACCVILRLAVCSRGFARPPDPRLVERLGASRCALQENMNLSDNYWCPSLAIPTCQDDSPFNTKILQNGAVGSRILHGLPPYWCQLIMTVDADLLIHEKVHGLATPVCNGLFVFGDLGGIPQAEVEAELSGATCALPWEAENRTMQAHVLKMII